MKRFVYKRNNKKRFSQSNFDTLGSYTGNPIMGDKPQQDADDL